MFNAESLVQIDLLYEPDAPVKVVIVRVERLLAARHGSDEVTIVTQQQMMGCWGPFSAY